MKRTTTLLAFLSLFSCTLFAQQAKQKSSILIGENLGANITSFKPLISGYVAGLNAIFWADRRFSLETGLEYSTVVGSTLHVDYDNLKFFDQLYSGNATALDITRSTHFISLPVKGMVNYGKGKVHFFSGLGVLLDCYFKSSTNVKAYYEGYSSEGDRSYLIKRNNLDCFSGMAFTGMIYDMGTSWQLRSTVSVRHYTPSPFHYDGSTTMGVSLGLYYKVR